MKPSIQRDLAQLEEMLASHNKLTAQLNNPELPHPERQSIEVGLCMLRELMANKTRDIKRRLRDTREY